MRKFGSARQGAIVSRVNTLTAASNIYTPDLDGSDVALISSPTANFTLAAPTGTPVDGQRLLLRIKSSGTGYAPTWNTIFASSGVATLPTTSLPINKTVSFLFIYDAVLAKLVLLAMDSVGY